MARNMDMGGKWRQEGGEGRRGGKRGKETGGRRRRGKIEMGMDW